MVSNPMRVVDRGAGAPLVIVPGVQGRWEYMRPTVDALAEHFRVITFSLCRERSSRRSVDPREDFDPFVDQLAGVLNDRGLPAAIICGVSFGGLIALRFAARHPERTMKLVLVSTPGPGWRLKRRHQFYARLPWIFGPVFLAETPWRLRRELRAAMPDAPARRAFRRAQLRTFVEAPVSLARLAARARLIGRMDAAADCRRITVPTLVVTGESALDHVVSTGGSAAYANLIAGARAVVLEGTGHLGAVTRPHAFARLLRNFTGSTSEAAGSPRSTQPQSRPFESSHDAA
jgi:pimeloyl-ACP methyl ester carboxylesterase